MVQTPPLPGNSFAPKPATRALQAGETVPDFSLVAQDGSTLRLGSLRGRVVLIDFIYTRCPMPEACPRLSANFAYLQRHFGGRIDLISITLDPKWDKPPVLEAYAKRWAADTRPGVSRRASRTKSGALPRSLASGIGPKRTPSLTPQQLVSLHRMGNSPPGLMERDTRCDNSWIW